MLLYLLNQASWPLVVIPARNLAVQYLPCMVQSLLDDWHLVELLPRLEHLFMMAAWLPGQRTQEGAGASR